MFTTIGIIGQGQFGAFWAKELSPYAEVRTYDPHVQNEWSRTLAHVCASDVVIFAVPMKFFETACAEAAAHIAPDTPIVDVASIKEKPIELLKKHFPHNPILGTHPIFGPQSGKHGIAGFPITVVNVSWEQESYDLLLHFLTHTLQLRVIEQTAAEHDKQMAYVMGLSHFIGRAVKHMGITEYATSTLTHKQLVLLRDTVQYDTWDLFETIQNENPYAKEVRDAFMHELQLLEKRLSND